jgi:hypothetical protein
LTNISDVQKPLGPIVTVYRDRPLRWRDFFLVFMPATLMVLAPFAYGLWRNLYAQAYYGPVAARAWSWPWYALATTALVPLLLLALLRVRRAHRSITLHKKGLDIRWTGGQRHILPWRQISGLACNTVQHVFLSLPLGTQSYLTIFPLSGKPIYLDDRIPQLPDLATQLKNIIYPNLFPQLQAAYKKGETLYFGPVTLKQNSIQLREQEIPWKQITSLNIQVGELVVESKTKRPIKVPIGLIPNVELLIQLLQEGVAT